MDLIKQGRLRIDSPAVRQGLISLGNAVPELLPHVTALLTLGYVANPISVSMLTHVLNQLG